MTVSTGSKRSAVLAAAIIGLILVIAAAAVSAEPAEAASIKKKTPKYKALYCYYGGNGTVNLKWGKIKGAKKYVVYRAARKNGKYKKFASTKKTSISKAGSGDFYYKVRAFKGKAKSKFSNPKRIFAATAYIMGKDNDFISTYYKVLVTNKTKVPMVFLSGYSSSGSYIVRIADLNNPYAQPVESVSARLDTPAGTSKLVNPNSSAYINVEVYNYEDTDLGETGLRDATYVRMLTSAFKANGQTLALAYTDNVNDSAVAGA